jgi:hypothetical protein
MINDQSGVKGQISEVKKVRGQCPIEFEVGSS